MAGNFQEIKFEQDLAIIIGYSYLQANIVLLYINLKLKNPNQS